MCSTVLIALVSIGGIALVWRLWRTPKQKQPTIPFPEQWRTILHQHVPFYEELSAQEQVLFERKVHTFLLNYRITGVEVEITDVDRLLVASSAIIPVFYFENWEYTNLTEVLIYPNAFNEKYEFHQKGNRILGMVGTGPMEGKMILSREALLHGFKNETDKKNTAIHEFVHLIDKMDGDTDGLPKMLMQRQYAIPWLKLVQQKMDEIHNDDSDLNPYGGTSKTEFFAVASEYFFERPKLMEEKHPELYKAMKQVFKVK
jgi:Mlc titration factor MtfA (ptsG expression regulator)